MPSSRLDQEFAKGLALTVFNLDRGPEDGVQAGEA